MKAYGTTPDYTSAEFLARFFQFFQRDDDSPDYEAHRKA